ncbi:trpE operon leader peptide TrpLE [Sinorhizobium sp. FG01]
MERRLERAASFLSAREHSVLFSRLREAASHANTSPMANTQNISIWWWAR